jgi:hypothetical protein
MLIHEGGILGDSTTVDELIVKWKQPNALAA